MRYPIHTSQKSIWAKTTNITCCSFCTLVTICTFGCHWLPGFYLGEWTSYINSINLCRCRLCPLTEIKARVEENFEKNEWIDGFFLNWNLRANDALQDQKHLSLPNNHWGNPGLARCREMATLPAGYIPQRKVPSASSSGSLFHCVCAVL